MASNNLWVCLVCKKVLGEIVSDETVCDCHNYYDFDWYNISTCPECGSDEVYFERFMGPNKSGYACGDCGWEFEPSN